MHLVLCGFVRWYVVMCIYVRLCAMACDYVFWCVIMCCDVWLCAMACDYVLWCMRYELWLCVVTCGYVLWPVIMCCDVWLCVMSRGCLWWGVVMRCGMWLCVMTWCSCSIKQFFAYFQVALTSNAGKSSGKIELQHEMQFHEIDKIRKVYSVSFLDIKSSGLSETLQILNVTNYIKKIIE